MTFLTLVITRFESKSDFAMNIKSYKKTLAGKKKNLSIRVSCKTKCCIDYIKTDETKYPEKSHHS